MMADPILMNEVAKLVSSPAISEKAISSFVAVTNAVTRGIDVSFVLADAIGIASVTLLRNYVLDSATATVLQTWDPMKSKYTWSDTDTALQQQASAYYWLTLAATGTSGRPVTVGPQNILLNPQLATPVPAVSISASHAAAVNGNVMVTVNVTGTAASEKIYLSGYKGNAGFVAVAQSAVSPLQFVLQATGETVTLKAVGVSFGGSEATSAPTTTLMLNGVLTVPAQPQGVQVVQIAAGNQVSFPASRDAGPTYKLYRAQRGQTFLLATMLATVTGTAGTIVYLDTAGLSGDWGYFIVATNAAGDSSPSASSSPVVLLSSAGIPPNSAGNTSNTALIDSVDTGTTVLVRVSGPGGLGTSYSRLTGYGSLSRPNGTISGLSYLTLYVILWTGSAYLAVTTYPATLPDAWEFVGSLRTTGQTGVVGTGATATAVVNGAGNVIQINPVAVGSGYGAATVNIAGGGGSGAAATAVISGGQVVNYTVTNGGSGYASAPTVTVVGGGTSGTVGGGGSSGGSGGSRGGNGVALPL